jgi:hypothetical protein
MKFNIATLVATACANPLTVKTDNAPNLHNVEDTLTDGVMIDTQPTMESVPDLKDFLSTLYGEALTDDQILSMLIGSTPSPQIDNYETTAAAIVNDVETDTELATDSATDQDASTDQELVHVLNAEMNLIESLKKTEVQLAEELRELQILKEQQNVLLGGDATIIDVELSSSTQMTSLSTVCMALVALLLL